jgi:hypothetical protein
LNWKSPGGKKKNSLPFYLSVSYHPQIIAIFH